MRKFILAFLVAILIAPAAHAHTIVNSYNTTYNKYVTHKNVFKKSVVEQHTNIYTDDDPRWNYGLYAHAPNLVEVSKNLYVGAKFRTLGIFDNAIKDDFEILLGLTYTGTLLNLNN